MGWATYWMIFIIWSLCLLGEAETAIFVFGAESSNLKKRNISKTLKVLTKMIAGSKMHQFKHVDIPMCLSVHKKNFSVLSKLHRRCNS
jgi:hypothetical protein